MPRVNAMGLARIERTYRGTKFVLEEADTATYDDCVQNATTTTANLITGEDEEKIDENLVLRLLLRKCLLQPKLDFTKVGARLMRQLERDIRELHFGLEPTEPTAKNDDDDDGDDDSPNEPEG